MATSKKIKQENTSELFRDVIAPTKACRGTLSQQASLAASAPLKLNVRHLFAGDALWELFMKRIPVVAFVIFMVLPSVNAGLPPVGAAPKGDAKAVASRIIKYNFPSCKRVTTANRMQDGSIRATCDGVDYLVFTVFNAKEGKTIEVAMNCTAAKQLLNIDC